MELAPVLSAINLSWSQIIPNFFRTALFLLLLLVGFLVAKLAAWLISNILKKLTLDKLAQKVGFTSLLEKGEVKRSASDLLGDLVYWLILFVTLAALANFYGLPIDQGLNEAFGYLGLVLLVALTLGLGLFFASFFATLVRVIAANFGIDGAKTLSRIIYYLVVISAFIMGLSQLGIKSEVLVAQIGVFIGAVGLAGAIAFGLGCKDMAADFLHNLFKGK